MVKRTRKDPKQLELAQIEASRITEANKARILFIIETDLTIKHREMEPLGMKCR